MTRKMKREVGFSILIVSGVLAILYVLLIPSPTDKERLDIARCNQAITIYEQTGKYLSTFDTACSDEVRDAVRGTYHP